MKKNNTPQFDEQGRKFLFFYMGQPVYEGDETHKELERVRKDGGVVESVKKEAKKFFDAMDKTLKK